jgi:hypothetical protein
MTNNDDMMVSEIMDALGLGRAKVEELMKDVEPAYKSRRYSFYKRSDVLEVAKSHVDVIRQKAERAQKAAQDAQRKLDSVLGLLSSLEDGEAPSEPSVDADDVTPEGVTV